MLDATGFDDLVRRLTELGAKWTWRSWPAAHAFTVAADAPAGVEPPAPTVTFNVELPLPLQGRPGASIARKLRDSEPQNGPIIGHLHPTQKPLFPLRLLVVGCWRMWAVCDCGSEGRGFNPHRSPCFCRLPERSASRRPVPQGPSGAAPLPRP